MQERTGQDKENRERKTDNIILNLTFYTKATT